ncbi:MAG: hypothetical protein G01um101472_164 [Parcubacteria group bacterium Gr01-1014_72]|nr:MAG: hypothetical protein G01um101472_164 [Parcubacteria group bacterium Gr01-1014_72]
MRVLNKKEPLILLLGDIVFFYSALWLTLLMRYGEFPDVVRWREHVVPFSFLCALSIAVFFIAGLYEKHTILFRSKLPTILLNAGVANSILAVAFFYFIPAFGITPKVNLFIYIIVSFLLSLSWRSMSHVFLGARHRQNALLIGSGEEMRELQEEVNGNSRYGMRFISSVDVNKLEGLDFQEEIVKRLYVEEVGIIAVDLRSDNVEPILPHLYNLIFSRVQFVDMHRVYEDIFDRIPLSLVRYNWFLENISVTPRFTYTVLKRLMDIFVSFVLGALSIVLYPFVYVAIKLDDGGPLFLTQERIGRGNHIIHTRKFRSMNVSNAGGAEHITRVGKFLRTTRIDELPQLWNVFRGDLSLIGPRPELPELVKLYEKEIPYYNIRHLLKPGLSGWAQLYHKNHPHYRPDVSETRVKLSYDLYYIKNRSLLLDLKIALKTIKTLLSRSGA